MKNRFYFAILLILLVPLIAQCGRREGGSMRAHNGASVITVWYGRNQSFGQLGNPQQWINVLGNVSDSDSVSSLTYSLNGDQPESIAIGPATVPKSPITWECYAKKIKREASA